MLPNTDIAVFTDGAYVSARGRILCATGEMEHVTDIARIGLAHAGRMRSLWIDPASELARRAAEAQFWAPLDGWRLFATGPRNRAPTVARVHQDTPGRHDAEVFVYAAFDTVWKAGAIGAEAMLQAVSAYEAALGVEVQWSPARTALEALKQHNHTDKRRDWLAPLTEKALYTIPYPEHRAPAHVNRFIQAARYCHVYDKTGAYLAACTRRFGAGDPLWLTAGDYDPNGYGFWKIDARRGPQTDNQLPSPFSFAHGRAVYGEWFYTPQIEIAKKYGWDVTPIEGYGWGVQHLTLSAWAKELWEARQHAKAAGYLATAAMLKASYTQAYGIMAYIPEIRRPPAWYMRPDFSGMIVAESYARQLATIQAMPAGYLACSTDSIAILSDEADPWAAAPHLAARRGRIGEYKHVCSLMGPADIILATQGGMHAPALFALIQRLAASEVPAND